MAADRSFLSTMSSHNRSGIALATVRETVFEEDEVNARADEAMLATARAEKVFIMVYLLRTAIDAVGSLVVSSSQTHRVLVLVEVYLCFVSLQLAVRRHRCCESRW